VSILSSDPKSQGTGVRGAQQYGQEDIRTVEVREEWTFPKGQAGDEKRFECAARFWETLHIDLRTVDTSDFTIAYLPMSIYSVGRLKEYVPNEEWLLWELDEPKAGDENARQGTRATTIGIIATL
jgi:hypothetical protein